MLCFYFMTKKQQKRNAGNVGTGGNGENECEGPSKDKKLCEVEKNSLLVSCSSNVLGGNLSNSVLVFGQLVWRKRVGRTIAPPPSKNKKLDEVEKKFASCQLHFKRSWLQLKQFCSSFWSAPFFVTLCAISTLSSTRKPFFSFTFRPSLAPQ